MFRRWTGKSIRHVLLLVACLIATGYACAPKAQPALAQQYQPSPLPSPTVSPAKAESAAAAGPTPLDRLCACQWVDVYDSAFILTFDKIGGRMIERNGPAGIKRTSRIAVEEDVILLYDDLGLLLARLPYTLSEDTLSIDYGDTLGVLEYRALR